ncbi:MAG: uracil-DNA glycosylase [Acidobacteriia bacterium]|nr:uracil-DNA glycosylase [Terriglobia bacterium]
MSDLDSLGREILEHLRCYRDRGVRLAADRPGTRQPGTASTTASGRPSAATAAPSKIAVAVSRASLFDEQALAPEDLHAIRTDLGDCQRCKLARTRTNIVFGVGNPKAELMFVGEAPGADEDEQGLPFVGRAGQLLTRIIQAIEMQREDVYICNILKCRPPQNRNPEADEIAACQSFLFRQIASVRPRVICALGTFGAQTLLRTKEPISRLRGQFIDFHGAKFIATFHPAYLLRNPNEKRKVWEDVQKIRDYLRSFHT